MPINDNDGGDENIEPLGGKITGGRSIEIQSIEGLWTIQDLCASPDMKGINDVYQAFGPDDPRIEFHKRKVDWENYGQEYGAKWSGKLTYVEDAMNDLDWLKIALEVANNIWQNELNELKDPHSLTMIISIAEVDRGKLELQGTETALILSSGSIKSLITKPGRYLHSLGAWAIAIVGNIRVAPTSIAYNIVKGIRQRKLNEIPAGHSDILRLRELEGAASNPNTINSKYRNVIIFLHGLLSTDIGTFDGFIEDFNNRYSAKSKRTLLVGWPHDTLTAINDNAYDLCGLLRQLVNSSNPNIVFVCHSRGGLVARAVAMNAYNMDNRYRSLIKGCVTFGTPHNGADLADEMTSREFLSFLVCTYGISKARGSWLVSDVLRYMKRQPRPCLITI